MTSQLNALLYIFVVATVTFFFLKKAIGPLADTNEFKSWRNTWYVVTLFAFVISNFWLFIVAAGVYVWRIAKRRENLIALYIVLLLAVPPVPLDIPGFVVDKLFIMTYPRLLALVILLPAYLMLRRSSDVQPFGKSLPDKLFLAFALLYLALLLRGTTFTDMLRVAIYVFTDYFLPYYVASRSLKSLHDLKKAMTALFIGTLVAGVIGIYEHAVGWLLYADIAKHWGIFWEYGGYMLRGGDVRATSSLSHSIIFGFVMMISLGFFLYLSSSIKSKLFRIIGGTIIALALVASLSRGPWVGCVALLFVFCLIGPKLVKHMGIFLIALVLVLPTLKVIPGGEKIINILPIIGQSEQFNVEYRDKLIDTSIVLIKTYPFFGVHDPRLSPEMQGMMQGEGIVDIVNSYLQIVLEQGIVGLTLFLGFFAAVLIKTFRSMRQVSDKQSEAYLCGQSLIATMVAILVTISFVSSIGITPILYWMIAGLMLSYARIVSTESMQDSPEIIGMEKAPVQHAKYPSTLVR